MLLDRADLWIAVAAFVALFTGLIATPVAMRVLTRWGVVDRPDGERKIHSRVVPVGGGVAVCLAMIAGSLCGYHIAGLRFFTALLIGSAALTAAGLFDDAKGLRGRQKLLIQLLIAAFVVYVGDIHVRGFEVFGKRFALGHLGPAFAVCWIIGTINAVNLIDGADGLASIVGITLGGALVALCVALNKPTEAVVPAALVGALLAFLLFNKPPAKVFLGDAGSQLIGLVLGASALQASLKGPATLALTAIVAIFMVPMFDVVIAILRRRLTGRSVYYPDRGHLHHRLAEKGLADNWLLGVVGALCLVTAAGAVVSVSADNELFALVGVGVVLGVLIFGRLFGHSEVWHAVRRGGALAGSMVPLALSSNRSEGTERTTKLRGTRTREWDELWKDVRAFAESVDLAGVHLSVHVPTLDEDYSATWRHPDRPAYERTWKAEIPLVSDRGVVGRLQVTGRSELGVGCAEVAELVVGLQAFEVQILDLVSRDTGASPSRAPEGSAAQYSAPHHAAVTSADPGPSADPATSTGPVEAGLPVM